MSDIQELKVAVLVLVADDEAGIRLIVEEALSDGGFAVISASNGEEAIRQVDAHANDLQAIVVDIRMGSGPDGWAVGRHARESNPNIAVVYMSGDSAADWNAQGVPNSVVLQKPFTPAQIVTAVATLLNQVPPNRPAPQTA